MSRDGNSGAGIVLKKLETVFYKRKMVLKKTCKSMRNAMLEELPQELRSLRKTPTESTTTGITTSKGGAPTSISEKAKNAQTELEGPRAERLGALEALKRRNE